MKFNGTEIFIETLPGTGDLNFVLIPNAGGDHRFFTYQLDLLRQFGNVVQFDLPGSGKSPPIASYSMADLASIVSAICQQLFLKRVCLVGLNNGANLALETTLRGSIGIEKLILIDPPIFMNNALIEEIKVSIASLKKEEFTRSFVASFVDQLFLHADSEGVCNLRVRRFSGLFWPLFGLKEPENRLNLNLQTPSQAPKKSQSTLSIASIKNPYRHCSKGFWTGPSPPKAS